MSKNLTRFNVFVASPGDLTDERQRIKELERDLRDDAEAAGYALSIRDWHDVGPAAGRPQGVVFSQLPPGDWDVFIGMLWQRFGTPSGAAHPGTGDAFDSGTEEEFYHAFEVNRETGGSPAVLTYRCLRAIPPTANFKQLGAVQEFFEKFGAGQEHEALIGVFESAEDLVRKVSNDLRRLFRGTTAVRPEPKPLPADSLDIPAYREHIRKHYRHLQLEALGGDTVYRDIQLQQVFIPQDVRDCGAWLPAALEGPGELTREDADTSLAELHEQRRFGEGIPRDIADAMEPPAARCRVLLGAPGAGKSSFTRISLLRWLDAKQDANPPIPVLVELRRFHRSGSHDFLDYLATDKDLVFRFPRAALEARLHDGTAELLVDGLDEIFDPEHRATVTGLIARCAETFPQARILVTSRLVGYDGRLLRDAGFAHWLLADFDDKKIATFLDHWIADAIREPDDRPIVRGRLEDALKSTVIREMAGNPLLLTFMAVLARKSNLPRDHGSLYEKTAALLLDQWDASRYLKKHLEFSGNIVIDDKDKHDLLRDLAWKMQTSENKRLRGNLISADEVRAAMHAAFASRIPDPGQRRKAIERLLDQLIERNYLLCHVGGAQFAFVHRGFLEYFASEHLVHLVATQPGTAVEEIGKIYRDHAEDDAWEEVLILAATRFEPAVADKILPPLVEGSKGAEVGLAAIFGHPHPFVLACQVLTRAREPQKLARTSATARGVLEWWINAEPENLYAEDWVYLLGASFPDDATRTLLADLACRDENTSARRGAVASLAAHFPDYETRALLTDLARRDEDTDARCQAVASLPDHFRDDDTRALLTDLARRGEDTKARCQAVASLADHFRDDDTRALLTDLAGPDEHANVRRQAIASLADHFRDYFETAELLRKIVAGNRGPEFVSDIAVRYVAPGPAREYLQSFLRNPGEAAPPETV